LRPLYDKLSQRRRDRCGFSSFLILPAMEKRDLTIPQYRFKVFQVVDAAACLDSHAKLAHEATVPRKGKPVVRRGRKVMGPVPQ